MNREELTKLPGRPEEQGWLRERLEVLTVREGIALDAAVLKCAPASASEAVNLLANLDEYEVVGGIRSDKDLGVYYLEESNASLLALRDYISLAELGRTWKVLHPGLSVQDCYVMYPKRESPQPYDGVTLPGPDYSWSLRLKLASPAAPKGAWLALPDYNDIMDVRPGEIRLALDALGAQVASGGPVQPAGHHRAGSVLRGAAGGSDLRRPEPGLCPPGTEPGSEGLPPDLSLGPGI